VRNVRHIFSSGEVLYKENVRELDEGKLVAECLVYDDIQENIEYICLGSIDGRQARIRFRLSQAGENKVLSRHSMNILMQSDVFKSEWEKYEIEWLD